MKVEIKKLSSPDIEIFKELILVFEDVFEMKNFEMPHDNHLRQLLSKNDFYVFVALSNGEVVGGLTAYTLQQYYSERPLVYVYDLAVKTDMQRKGIGTKLMAEIVDYCQKTGVEEVFVQADEIDQYAVDFYRSTGAVGEKVIHFYYPLKTKD